MKLPNIVPDFLGHKIYMRNRMGGKKAKIAFQATIPRQSCEFGRLKIVLKIIKKIKIIRFISSVARAL